VGVGGLGTMYDVHLGLIGKRVVDSINGTFRIGVTAEALRANIDWKSAISLQRSQFDLKFQLEGIAPTNHSYCHKTRVNDLSCGIRMPAQLSFVFFTNHAFDRQTDRQNLYRLIASAFHAARWKLTTVCSCKCGRGATKIVV